MTAAILFVLVSLMPPPPAAPGVPAAVDLYEHGKFEEAREVLTGLVRQDPKNPNVLMWLGKTCIKLHRWDEAIKHLEQARALGHDNALIHFWLAHAYGAKAAHSFLSAFSWARKTVDEFKTALKLAPDNLDIRFDLIDFYLQAPGFLGGGKDKAEAEAEQIVKLDPRLGYSARAEVLEDRKEWDRARNELLQAVSKFPDYAGGYVDLSEFCLKRREYEDAAAYAQKALALDGANRTAKFYLAEARLHLRRDLPDALSALRTLAAGPLTDDDPSFEEIYYWLGQAYLAQGQKSEARQAFETSLSFDPDFAGSKQALAQIKQLPNGGAAP